MEFVLLQVSEVRVSVFRICVKLGSEARLGSPFCVCPLRKRKNYGETFPRDLDS